MARTSLISLVPAARHWPECCGGEPGCILQPRRVAARVAASVCNLLTSMFLGESGGIACMNSLTNVSLRQVQLGPVITHALRGCIGHKVENALRGC